MSSDIGNLCRILLFCLDPSVCLLPKTLKLFGFAIMNIPDYRNLVVRTKFDNIYMFITNTIWSKDSIYFTNQVTVGISATGRMIS